MSKDKIEVNMNIYDIPIVVEQLEKANKETERLNNIINEYKRNTIPTLEHNIDVLVEQEDRANNIINELEKWLVEWREMLDCPDFYEEGIIDCINDTLTKLQELKGSDKE